MKRLVYMSLAVFFLLPLWSMQVSAGEVSGAESALIAIGQGQYEYDGAIYAFKSEYQTKLYNYLSRDDVDLSQGEVNDYISQFYGNLASACTSQYMYKVSDAPKPSPNPTPAEPSPTPAVTPVTPAEPSETPAETEPTGENTIPTETPAKPAGSKADRDTKEETAVETETEETGDEPVSLPAVDEKPVVTETVVETVPETEIAETEEKKDYSQAERVDNRFRFEMVIGVIVVVAIIVLLLLIAGKTAKRKKWHRE